MKSFHRICALSCILLGCRDEPDVPESPHAKVTEISYTQGIHQEQASSDFMHALRSYGKSIIFEVEKGEFYEIKVSRIFQNSTEPSSYKKPAEEKEIYKQVIEAKSKTLDLGVYHSSAYSFKEDNIIIDHEKKVIVIEINGKTITQNLEIGYDNPWATASRTFSINKEFQPFLVMFDPNDMGASDMDMAIEHAMMSRRGEIISSIRKIKSPRASQ